MSRDSNRFTPSWDAYSLALISCFVLLGLFQWQLMPRYIDIYYHLSVARSFKLAGGLVTTDFLQCAPLGRPHLYPPLLHILMLAVSAAGGSALFIARLFEFIAYPGLLTMVWLMMRSLLHARCAFFAVMLCSAATALYYTSGILLPFTLAVVLLLLVFLCIEKGRFICAGIVLALSCYTHTLMSLTALLAVALYGLCVPQRRRACIGALLIALVAVSPFLAYQYRYRSYCSLSPVSRGSSVEFSLIVYALAAGGLILAMKRRGVYLFFVAFVLAMSVFALIDPSRYFSSHGMIGFILLASVSLDELYVHLVLSRYTAWRVLTFICALIACCIINPIIYRDSRQRSPRLYLMQSNLAQFVPLSKKTFYHGAITLHHPRYMDPLIAFIRQHTAADDIIWSNLPYVGGLLSVMSQRALSGSMMTEVECFDTADQMANARLIVWFREGDGSVSPELAFHVERLHLQSIAVTEVAYVYLNPSCTSRQRIPPNSISTPLLFCMVLMAVAAAVAAGVRGAKKQGAKK